MRRWAAVLGLLALAGCGRHESLAALAAQGQIQQDAPIKCTASITIPAPPAKVWAILSDIQHWPNWQSDISQTSVGGSPANGTEFSWNTAGMSIHSQIRLFVPDQEIAWTGSVINFHAVHVWTLTALPGGGTLVTTRESMSGLFITFFYSTAELLQSDQRWLQALQAAAEH